MRKIERIFIHCTASSQKWGVKELMQEFKNKGWKNPGYHIAVTADGVEHQLLSIDKVSNGVKGYNSTAINIAYVGGIDLKGHGVDNRTDKQKETLRAIVTRLKKQFPNAMVLGHRDISPDINKNGNVDPWERIKECPCFNAIDEYKLI